MMMMMVMMMIMMMMIMMMIIMMMIIEGPLGRAHRRPSIFDRAQRYSRAKEKQAVQNRRQERGRHRRRGARFFFLKMTKAMPNYEL